MPTIVDDWIAEIRDAIRHTPIDWDAIRSAKVSLRVEARTLEQKSAVETLMLASDRPAVQQAAPAIERALLHGMPGDDGWPLRF